MPECSICRRQFDGRFKVMVPPSAEAFDSIECARRAATLRGLDAEALTPVVLPTLSVVPFESPPRPLPSGTPRRSIAALAALLLAPGQAALAGGVGLAAAGTAASIYLTTRPAVQPAPSVSVTAAAPPRSVKSSEPAPASGKAPAPASPGLAVSRPPDAAARTLIVAPQVRRHAGTGALVSTSRSTHSTTVATSDGAQLISRAVPVTRPAPSPVSKPKAKPAHARPKAKPKPRPKPKPTPTVAPPSTPTSTGSPAEAPTAGTPTRQLASAEVSTPTTPNSPGTSPGGNSPPSGGNPPPSGGNPPPSGGNPPPPTGGGTPQPPSGGNDGSSGGGSGGHGGCDGHSGNGWGDGHHDGHDDHHGDHGDYSDDHGDHHDDHHGDHGDHGDHGHGHGH
jgi:hypothetical protein